MPDPNVRPFDAEAARIKVSYFEMLYGVPSERLVEVFTTADGTLIESRDFTEWSFLYGTLRDAEAAIDG